MRGSFRCVTHECSDSSVDAPPPCRCLSLYRLQCQLTWTTAHSVQWDLSELCLVRQQHHRGVSVRRHQRLDPAAQLRGDARRTNGNSFRLSLVGDAWMPAPDQRLQRPNARYAAEYESEL